MANNIIESGDLDFSNGSYSSEEEQEEVEIFDENRKSVSLEANTRKVRDWPIVKGFLRMTPMSN